MIRQSSYTKVCTYECTKYNKVTMKPLFSYEMTEGEYQRLKDKQEKGLFLEYKMVKLKKPVSVEVTSIFI